MFFVDSGNCPSIAQLVERWTVVGICQTSIGRWFKSGSREIFASQLEGGKLNWKQSAGSISINSSIV